MTTRRIQLVTFALLLGVTEVKLYAQCHLPIPNQCGGGDGCVPIQTSYQPITTQTFDGAGYYGGGKCGTKWCWKLRCPCGQQLGAIDCNFFAGPNPTLSVAILGASAREGSQCRNRPEQVEKALLSQIISPNALSVAPFEDPFAVQRPDRVSLHGLTSTTESEIAPLRRLADRLAGMESFSIHADAYAQFGDGEEIKAGRVLHWSDARAWRLVSEVTSLARRQLPFEVMTDVEATFDGDRYGFYFSDNSELTLRSSDPKQLPAPFPNPLALVMGVFFPDIESISFSNPSAAVVREKLSQIDWGAYGTNNQGSPRGAARTLYVSGRDATAATAVELAAGAITYRRIGSNDDSSEVRIVMGAEGLPRTITLTGVFDGQPSELRLDIAWHPNTHFDRDDFSPPLNRASAIIDADSRELIRHPQLGDGGNE